MYEFEELSSEGQSQFLAARNDSEDEVTFSDPARTPHEFQYGDHGATVTYVVYEDGYYLMATRSSSCLAALCDIIRGAIGVVALAGIACIGFALWRRIDWDS